MSGFVNANCLMFIIIVFECPFVFGSLRAGTWGVFQVFISRLAAVICCDLWKNIVALGQVY